jgi:hypothetical protein
MLDQPTVAAVILPERQPEAAAALVARAMEARGYARRDAPPPAGYPRAEGEWVSIWLGTRGDLTVLVPEDVGLVFRLACWVSAEAVSSWVAGLRRYMGSAPTLKLYAGGAPRWRDGEDLDLEVDWHVPTTRPIDVPEPSRVGLPDSAASAVQRLGPLLAPWRVLAARDGAALTGWLAATSPLTRR